MQEWKAATWDFASAEVLINHEPPGHLVSSSLSFLNCNKGPRLEEPLRTLPALNIPNRKIT